MDNSMQGNTKKLTIYTADGNPLINGYVRIYSLDEDRYVFMGQTDKKGRVDFKIENDKSKIKEKLNSKRLI